MLSATFKKQGAGSTSGSYEYDGYHKYDRGVASDYEKDREAERHWQREDEFIKSYFANHQVENLLDIPVGTGRFFQHYIWVKCLTGVDVSEEMLTEARKKLPLLPKHTTVSLERGDVFELRFAGAQFDLTIVCRLLHLLPPQLLEKAIAELCRVTKGRLLVQSYVPVSWAVKVRDRFRKVPPQSDDPSLSSDIPVESNAPRPTRSWLHIRAYRHKQKTIDSLFKHHGFVRQQSHVLDRYLNSFVRVTIYAKQPRPV